MKIILFFIIFSMFIQQPAFTVTPFNCGSSSIKLIADKYGLKISTNELNRMIGYDQKKGNTMLGLLIASQKLNLPVVPVDLTPRQYCDINSPMIVWVDGNHFLVVWGCKWFDTHVVIQDPPGEKRTVPMKELVNRWNGEALVFSEKLKREYDARKVAEREEVHTGAHAYFDETVHFAGTVNEGTKLSHTFRFTNIGSDTLEVSARSTCICTAVLLSNNKIPPGGSGRINIKFNTNGIKGHTQHGAHIRTNDPDNKILKLTIAATVKSSVKAVPEKLWIDQVSIKEKITREILVIDSGDSTLKVESVKKPDGIRAKILPIRNKPFRAIPVVLTINTGNKPGDFERQIIIATNDKGKPEIPVTISGIVLGEAKVFPPVVFFGDVKPDEKNIRESTITSTNGDRIKIAKIATDSPYISSEFIPVEQGRKYTLRTVLKATEANSTVHGSLRVYAEGKSEPILKIPVYARIVGSNE